MKYGSLVFEENEFLKIKQYQESNVMIEDYAHKNVLDILHQHMATAMQLEAIDIPYDIIKMYSLVTVRGASGIRQKFQLVPPTEVNPKQNKISIVSSLGASVIGRALGDKISYGLPGEMMSLVIEKVKHSSKMVQTDIDMNTAEVKVK